MTEVVATCLWHVRRDVVLALDDRFGEPVDAYVNGAQVWLRDDGPGGATLEWRLHPVPGFRPPRGLSHHDLLEAVVYALRTGGTPPAGPEELWEGLEAFPAYGDELEPVPLAGACSASLGIPPDAYGVVDHDRIGDEWERSRGQTSIMQALEAQLGGNGA